MTYYAINYPCGVACNDKGDRYGTYYAFPTRAMRDEWIARGGDFRTSPNWREAIPSHDAELRRMMRKDDEHPGWVVLHGDVALGDEKEVAAHWDSIAAEYA